MAVMMGLHQLDEHAKRELDTLSSYIDNGLPEKEATLRVIHEYFDELMSGRRTLKYEKTLNFTDVPDDKAFRVITSVMSRDNITVVLEDFEQMIAKYYGTLYIDEPSNVVGRFGLEAILQDDASQIDLRFGVVFDDTPYFKGADRMVKSFTKRFKKGLGSAYVKSKEARKLRLAAAKASAAPYDSTKLDELLAGQQALLAGQQALTQGQRSLSEGQQLLLGELGGLKRELLEEMAASEYRLTGMMASVGELLEAKLGRLSELTLESRAELLASLQLVAQASDMSVVEDNVSMKVYRMLEEVKAQLGYQGEALESMQGSAEAMASVLLGNLLEGRIGFARVGRDKTRESKGQIMVGRMYNATLVVNSQVPLSIEQVGVTSQPVVDGGVIGGHRFSAGLEPVGGYYFFNPESPVSVGTGSSQAASIDMFGPEKGELQELFVRLNGQVELSEGNPQPVYLMTGPYLILRDSRWKKFKDTMVKVVNFAVSNAGTLGKVAGKLTGASI